MSANVFFQTIIFILRYHLKLSHFFSNHLYFVPIFNLQGYHQFFTRKLSIPSLVTSGFEVETWVVNFSGWLRAGSRNDGVGFLQRDVFVWRYAVCTAKRTTGSLNYMASRSRGRFSNTYTNDTPKMDHQMIIGIDCSWIWSYTVNIHCNWMDASRLQWVDHTSASFFQPWQYWYYPLARKTPSFEGVAAKPCKESEKVNLNWWCNRVYFHKWCQQPEFLNDLTQTEWNSSDVSIGTNL